MRKKSLIFFICLIFVSLSQAQQEKHQRVKISYSEINDLKTIELLGLPLDHGIHKKGYFIISEFSVSEIQKVKNAGFSVEILVDDVKEKFHQQNMSRASSILNTTCDEDDYQTPTNFSLGSMGGFLTYQEALTQLSLMRTLYPNLISVQTNISTFLTEGTPDASTTPSIGGNGIKWVRISDNPDIDESEPEILYTALQHAREPMSLSQLIFYMWYLLENYASDSEIQSIVDNTELYFVPIVNPDGYLYNEKTDPTGGGLWRKNRKNTTGVDINRNYDYYIDGDSDDGTWGGEGASSNSTDLTYHGTVPFSEVETQAIKWFVENHDFTLAINNHSFGNLLIFPFGYTQGMPTPANIFFEGLSNELVTKNGFINTMSSNLYTAAGNSDDFMYGTVGTHSEIYAISTEIGALFWPSSSQIIPTSKKMMHLNLTSAKMLNNCARIKDTSPTYVGNISPVNSTFNLKRIGVSGNGAFTVSINPISTNITSVGSPIVINNMNLLDEVNNSIQYTLGNGISPNDDISFELIVNNGSFDDITLVNKKFGVLNPAFADTGNDVTTNFTNNGWGITTATFVSSSSSITDSPSGNYASDTDITISQTSEVDLTSALGATVSFYAKWEIEKNFDYAQFEISTDNGSTWNPQCGNYTNNGSDNGTQPSGEPLYDGVQEDWVFEEIDLSDYVGQSILVRFQFVSDNNGEMDGFYFDDLNIDIVDASAVLNTNNISELNFGIYPNPVTDVLNITTPLNNYSVEVYNIHGQLINSSKNNSGSQSFNYSHFASGIYILKLSSDEVSQIVKIVKQ